MKRNSYRSDSSIKAQVEKELDKNPLLTAKPLCKILGLDYEKYGPYLRNLKHAWKYNKKNEVGLNRGKFKNWEGWVYCPPSVDLHEAVQVGWIQTKSRNHYLLWKSNLGRLELHPGKRRIRVIVKKPSSQAKAFQLLANAFFNTGLIFDLELFDAFAKSLRFKRQVFILPTSQKLPYAKINFLKESNGIIIKMGDRSHPNALEITFSYPDWGEKSEAMMHRNEATMDKLNQTFEKFLNPKPVPKEETSYIR